MSAKMQANPTLPLGHVRAEGEISAKIAGGLGTVVGVADAWDSLGSAWPSPMQYYIWTRAAAETFYAPDQLRVVTVGPASRPTAIAPLVKRRRISPHWELVSMPEIFAPMDFLYADPHSLACLANALVKFGAPLTLKRVPADSPTIEALRDAYRGRGFVVTTPDDGCPWIPLDANWLKPEEQLNAGRRSDFRRLLRRAEKIGQVTYEIVCPTLEQLGPLLEEAYRIEAASWKGEAGSALVHDERRRSFFTRYAMAACQKGILRMCFLRIGGEGAAMQMSAECGGGFWLLRVGYNPKFAHCSPGMLLLLHTIQYSAAGQLRSFEMLGPPKPWMEVVTKLERPCVQLRAYPFSLPGLTALAVDAVQVLWGRSKRWLRRLTNRSLKQVFPSHFAAADQAV